MHQVFPGVERQEKEDGQNIKGPSSRAEGSRPRKGIRLNFGVVGGATTHRSLRHITAFFSETSNACACPPCPTTKNITGAGRVVVTTSDKERKQKRGIDALRYGLPGVGELRDKARPMIDMFGV